MVFGSAFILAAAAVTVEMLVGVCLLMCGVVSDAIAAAVVSSFAFVLVSCWCLNRSVLSA